LKNIHASGDSRVVACYAVLLGEWLPLFQKIVMSSSSYSSSPKQSRHYNPLKYQELFTQHSIMSQHTWIFANTAVRTSDLTSTIHAFKVLHQNFR